MCSENDTRSALVGHDNRFCRFSYNTRQLFRFNDYEHSYYETIESYCPYLLYNGYTKNKCYFTLNTRSMLVYFRLYIGPNINLASILTLTSALYSVELRINMLTIWVNTPILLIKLKYTG